MSASPFFCLVRLSRHYLPPVAASSDKDESSESVKSCTEKVKRHTQGICSARKEHRSGWWLQVQGLTQEARPVEAGSQRYREDAVVLEGRSRGGSLKLKRSALQAAGYSDLSGRAKSSCEQAPAYDTRGTWPTNVRQTKHCTESRGPHDHRLQRRQLTNCHEALRRRNGFQVRGHMSASPCRPQCMVAWNAVAFQFWAPTWLSV